MRTGRVWAAPDKATEEGGQSASAGPFTAEQTKARTGEREAPGEDKDKGQELLTGALVRRKVRGTGRAKPPLPHVARPPRELELWQWELLSLCLEREGHPADAVSR